MRGPYKSFAPAKDGHADIQDISAD